MRRFGVGIFGVLLFAAMLSTARAVILFNTGDPAANTTAPTGDLAESGWQFEGIWGAYLGTPIAPHFFISASHIGNAGGGYFFFNGTAYTVGQSFKDPFSDLLIWQVQETFPNFAPLYDTRDEAGQHLVVIGRGTQRGGDFAIGDSLRGWNWGNSDTVERWGENVVSAIVSNGPVDDTLYATFDQGDLTNKAHLSSGDSGGAVFIQSGGVWKLAGINYAVDGPLSFSPDGSNSFNAALFDMRGLYLSEDGVTFSLVNGDTPVPSGFYATRIASKLEWIYSVIDPTGDFDGDGIPNELQYAAHFNWPAPLGLGLTTSTDNETTTIVYQKVVDSSLQYQVEQSSDLQTWTPVSSSDNVLRAASNVQTVQSQLAADTAPLFFRVRVSTSGNDGGNLKVGHAAYKIRSAP